MGCTAICEMCQPPRTLVKDGGWDEAHEALRTHRDEHNALFTVDEVRRYERAYADLKATDSQEGS